MCVCVCTWFQRVPFALRAADVWYTELQVPEQGVEYRYLVVQSLKTGDLVGLRVVRRETFIHPRRLSLSSNGSPTEGAITV